MDLVGFSRIMMIIINFLSNIPTFAFSFYHGIYYCKIEDGPLNSYANLIRVSKKNEIELKIFTKSKGDLCFAYSVRRD